MYIPNGFPHSAHNLLINAASQKVDSTWSGFENQLFVEDFTSNKLKLHYPHSEIIGYF